MDIQIHIKNYENYKGRTDVKTNTWFRLSNRFLEDHEFFDFNADEKIVWIYLLSLASQKNSGVIHVSYQHAHHVCKVDKKCFTIAIEKLIKIKCIERSRTRTLRGRYVSDTDPCATDRQTDITIQTNNTEQNIVSTEPNKSVAVAKPKKELVEFKFSETKTISVTKDLINSWADTFPKEFLDLEIKKARSWILSNPHKTPKTNWGKFLNGWFNRGWDTYRKTLQSNPAQMSPEEALAVLRGE